jgi:cytoskeletal protein RodZ
VDHLEFGRYLSQQRELRGMSREDVAARTKIPSSLLVALENGEAERLPERVFVANYVRAYAQVIGLAPEEAVLRYEEIYTGSNTVLSPIELERRRRHQAWRMLGFLLLLVAAALGVFWWYEHL